MNVKKILSIVLILFGFWLLSGIIANIFTISEFGTIDPFSNVVLLKLNSEITTDNYINGLSSTNFIKELDFYTSSPNIKAIIIEINSPGGSAVASKEIVDYIKKLRSDIQKNITIISYIRDIGTSGAYWVASSTEKIFANELSIVGGIGVTSSYLEFSGFLKKYNITYEQMISGQYKDMGTPFRELTDNERNILQKQLDVVYSLFIKDVALNRNISYDSVKKYSDGLVYLGLDAKNFSLIDDFGGRDEAVKYLSNKLSINIKIFEPIENKSFFESLLSNVISSIRKNDLQDNFIMRT